MRNTWIIVWALAGFLLFSGSLWPVSQAHAGPSDVIEGPVTVIDAGTLKIGDKIIKLHGVIAPGARQKCKKGSLPWLCGAAARKHMVELAQGKTIRCLKVGAYHGRCFKGGTDLAESLVRGGWAVPDKTGLVYRDDEDAARESKLGMWKYAE